MVAEGMTHPPPFESRRLEQIGDQAVTIYWDGFARMGEFEDWICAFVLQL